VARDSSIILRSSVTVGETIPSGGLSRGEIAIQEADGVLHTRKTDGSIRATTRIDGDAFATESFKMMDLDTEAVSTTIFTLTRVII